MWLKKLFENMERYGDRDGHISFEDAESEIERLYIKARRDHLENPKELLAMMYAKFERLGRRYGLLTEFRENGII